MKLELEVLFVYIISVSRLPRGVTGNTPDSGSGNRGSNPRGAAILFYPS